jgi:hypothetical protein
MVKVHADNTAISREHVADAVELRRGLYGLVECRPRFGVSSRRELVGPPARINSGRTL